MSEFEPIAVVKLSKDIRNMAKVMLPDEARLLVDSYYAMQKMRIQNGNRSFAMKNEPHEILKWLTEQSLILEKQVASALDKFSAAQPMGDWLRSVYGIGPVISAGLIAHIDIKQCPTVGHIWSFAGLNPEQTWGKGEKRPYNASLKVLCWKIGDSFKKFCNAEECVYGKIYKDRKKYEVDRDLTGYNEETCKKTLAKGYNLKPEQKKCYQSGHLPPGRLDLRASRYATKQFLSDMHYVWYKIEFKKEPPLPYPVSHLGHAHRRPLPSTEREP